MNAAARPLADHTLGRRAYEGLFGLLLLAVLLISTVDQGFAAPARAFVLMGFLLLVVVNMGAAVGVYLGAVALFSVHHFAGQGSWVQRPDNYMFLALSAYGILGRPLTRSGGRFGRSAVAAFLLVLTGLAHLIAIVGMSAYEISWFIRSIVMPLVLCFTLRKAAFSPGEARALLLAVAFIGLYQALVSVMEVAHLHEFILPPWLADPGENIAIGQDRAGGLPMQPEFNALDISMALCVILLLREFARGPTKVLWGSGALLCTVAVFLTYTRAAWLGLLAGGAALFWQVSGERGVTVRRRAMFITGAALVVGLLALLPNPMLRGRASDVGTVYFRLSIWMSGLDILGQHPILGIGFGQFGLYLPDYLEVVDWIPQADMPREGTLAHNTTLSIAAEFGLVGLALYLATLFGLYRAAKNAAGAAWGARGACWVTAYVLVYLVNAQFVTAHKLTSNVIFYGVLGAVAGMRFVQGGRATGRAPSTPLAVSRAVGGGVAGSPR